jgi:hypothetical protein
MPTYPTTGLSFGNFLTHSNAQTDGEGLVHSQSLSGGYQEVKSIAERNLIPVKSDAPGDIYSGFTASGDGGWSSGRRKVGMLVYCLDVNKLYILKPVGYFGNGGNGDEAAWLALPEPERAVRIFPSGSFTSGLSAPPPPITSTYTDAASLGINVNAENVALTAEELEASCWVELVMGIDGNPISGLDYTEATGSLKITLTHDGSGTGTPIEFEVFVDNYTSALADTSTNVPTAVGGFNTVDTVAGLNGLTQNQMWDKLLFPTVNPVGSGVSVTLNDPYNLEEAQSVITMSLTTSASDGTLSNPSGPWSGNINAAIIDDISAGGATIAQQVLTVSAPDTISNLSYPNYSVVLGENKFRLTGSFDQGPMPQDSTGADYPGAQFPAGDKTNTTAFEGVWPIYLGTSADGFVKRGLVGQSANDIPCVQNYGENSGTGLWHRIAIPQAMVQGGDITIQLDAGQLGFQASYPGSAWVRTSVTFDVHVDALAVPYYLYTKGNPQGGANTWIINW